MRIFWVSFLAGLFLFLGGTGSSFAGVPLSQKIGQLVMVGFRGTGLEGDEPSLEALKDDIRKGYVGGVILFDRDVHYPGKQRNIVSLQQVKYLTASLQKDAAIPLFVGVDQEGGRVVRLRPEHGMPLLAAPVALGMGTPDATEAAASTTAESLAKAGINLDFAPSLDVNIRPDSPAIGYWGRSFSEDESIVAQHGLAFARGLAKHRIIAAYKHFPGHGSARDDTHEGTADITRTWQARELAPYSRVLAQSPPAMVMVGHVYHEKLDAAYPASLSPIVVQGLLRREMGWNGVVVTDDLDMRALSEKYEPREVIRQGLLAGVDILLFGNNLATDELRAKTIHAIITDLVARGEVPLWRIEESYGRIMALKASISR